MGDFGGILIFLWSLLGYIGLPVVTVLVLIWIYNIKSNSETQTKQNEVIIRLLDNLNK